MNRESLYIEYGNLKAEMKGISPKLLIYKKLQEKLNDLKKRLGGNKHNTTTNDKDYTKFINKYNILKGINHNVESIKRQTYCIGDTVISKREWNNKIKNSDNFRFCKICKNIKPKKKFKDWYHKDKYQPHVCIKCYGKNN